MLGYISDQRTNTPASLCHVLLLPSDTDSCHPSSCFSLYAFAAKGLDIPSRPSHLVPNTGWTQTSPPGCSGGLLQAILISQLFIWNKALYCPGMPLNQHRAFSGAKGRSRGTQFVTGSYQVAELGHQLRLHGSFPESGCSSSGCPFSHTKPLLA